MNNKVITITQLKFLYLRFLPAVPLESDFEDTVNIQIFPCNGFSVTNSDTICMKSNFKLTQ